MLIRLVLLKLLFVDSVKILGTPPYPLELFKLRLSICQLIHCCISIIRDQIVPRKLNLILNIYLINIFPSAGFSLHKMNPHVTLWGFLWKGKEAKQMVEEGKGLGRIY